MSASQLLVGSPNRAADRSFPWALVAGILLKAAALAWMACFGFPREWGDMVFFKQPAYMALHTGAFSLPTAIGYRPFAEVTYAAYPPLYTYASLLVFWVLGFGVHASLAFDLGVHLILTGLMGWLLWRKTGSQIVAALFVLVSTGFLLPEGRPDEMAALLALLALLATARRRYVLVALLAGLSLATQPTQAILGLILCLSLDLASSGLAARFLARAVALAGGAVITCVLVWLPAIWAHLPEAIAQFRAHSSDRWAPSLAQLFVSDPIWAALWVFVVIFVAGYGLRLVAGPVAGLALLHWLSAGYPIPLLRLSAVEHALSGGGVLPGLHPFCLNKEPIRKTGSGGSHAAGASGMGARPAILRAADAHAAGGATAGENRAEQPERRAAARSRRVRSGLSDKAASFDYAARTKALLRSGCLRVCRAVTWPAGHAGAHGAGRSAARCHHPAGRGHELQYRPVHAGAADVG
jgi:hypothetical protein